MGSYKYLKKFWKNPKTANKERVRGYRKGHTIVRLDRPTRPQKARMLGYKAKQGFVVARVKIGKGGRTRPGIHKGRKPSKRGRIYYTPSLSKQALAEKRCVRKFMNLEVLNSYYVGEDGNYIFYDVILADPNHPVIKKDPGMKWLGSQRRRAFRGLTSAGRKARGLRRSN
jgi:large subunit ribosomal protein L15e